MQTGCMSASQDDSLTDDWDLIRRMAQGDRTSFSELYQRYSGQLFAFLVNKIGRTEAEDLSSDLLIRVWEHPPPQANSFRGWLYQVARNLVIDKIRRSKHQASELSEEVVVADRQPTPYLNAEYADKVNDSRDCLDRLDSEFREVMSRYMLGEDHQTISEALGIATGTSHSRLSRAKESLKQCMERKGW